MPFLIGLPVFPYPFIQAIQFSLVNYRLPLVVSL